ncbi:MAG: hypothetical protein ACJ8C3_18770 [Microvirga sp.]|jgi:hypothetical protein
MSARGGFRRSHAANACETILSNQRFAWCRMAAPAFVPDASYERALGAFTAEWAYAEAAVDMCNLVVLEAYGGRAIGDHLPTTIEERIDFFRKAHRTLPLLAPHARGGLPLIGRFAALRYDRHSLVTGLQLGFLAQLPADLQRTRCIPDSLFTEAKRFTEGEIDAKAAEAADIAAGLLAHAVALARAAAAAEPLVANGL